MSELVVEGTTLAYRLHGHAGPWTTLVHGGLVASPSWRAQLPAGEDEDGPGGLRGRLLTYDQRGYGATPFGGVGGDGFDISALAGDLVALWDRLDIQRTALVGFSMGALVALAAALDEGDRVSALVLVGSGDLGDDARATFRTRADAVESGSFAATIGDHARRAFSAAWVDAHPAEIEDYAALAATADPRAVAQTFRAIAEWSLPAAAAGAPWPVLLVNGELDGLFTPAAAAALAARLPRTRTVVADGAGHTLHMEQPGWFNRLVTDFVTEETA
jgi:pimeloyl-ACP methyl ester carboxylesterase